MIAGNLDGGLIAKLGVTSPNVRLNIDRYGGVSLESSVPIAIPSIPLGNFQIDLPSGNNAEIRQVGTVVAVVVIATSATVVTVATFGVGMPIIIGLGGFVYTIASDGTINLPINPTQASVLGFSFKDLTGNLVGIVDQRAALETLNAKLPIPGIGELTFRGRIGYDGAVVLTNEFAGSLLGFSAGMTNSLVNTMGAYRATVMADGPEAYWRLGDNYTVANFSNFLVSDETGRHNSGLGRFIIGAVNPVVQNQSGALAGDSNSSFRFSSGPATNYNSYIQVPASPAFHFANALTIETWLKVNQFDRNWQAIITKGDTAWRFHRYNNTGKIAFGTYSSRVTTT